MCIIGIPFGIFFIIADALAHKYLDPVFEQNFINHVKYPEAEARKKRCYSLVKWVFSIVYYMTAAIAAYFILLDTSYMPWWLGGNGNCTDCIRYVK